MNELGDRATTVLQQVAAGELGWPAVHAAEALTATGESAWVRTQFERYLPTASSSHFRTGIWRVLAVAARSPSERARWADKIEQAFMDPSAWDHPNAIESLCKIGHVVSGATLSTVREQAVAVTGPHALLYLWALQVAGDKGILERIIARLISTDPETREYAAYVLRWLHPDDVNVGEALAMAANAEPAGTRAEAAILGAALIVDADPSAAVAWRKRLDRILITTGSADDRLEASQALMRRYNSSDLVRLGRALEEPQLDTRVAAAWTIRYVLTHGKNASTP